MTFEQWWEDYVKISIYGKGYKALAEDAFEAGRRDGYDEGYYEGKEDGAHWEMLFHGESPRD